MLIAQELAEFVFGTTTIPSSTRDSAVRAVLDLIGASIVGYASPGGIIARKVAESAWGPGPATSWFSSTRLTVPGAAFANASMASMLDLDDGHRAAAGHPGASIIPAVIATADAYDLDAERILIAIVLGYEIAVRIAAARDLTKLDTLVSGRWCGQGAATAAAWLRGLPSMEVAQAIAISGTTAPNMSAVAHSRLMGNHVKEGIAWATATGLTATDLAAVGSTGPLDLLDNDPQFDPASLTNELGYKWYIDGAYFKPYSCCRWAHAAIDALIALQSEHSILADDIEALEVHLFARPLQLLNNDRRPNNLEAAQYSVPFCVALAAVRGTNALLPMKENSLGDPEVLSLSERIKLEMDPELDAMFPAAAPARVTIVTSESRVVRTVVEAKGEPNNPMTWENLVSKLWTATSDLVTDQTARSVVRAVEALDGGDAGPLRELLLKPLHSMVLLSASSAETRSA